MWLLGEEADGDELALDEARPAPAHFAGLHLDTEGGCVMRHRARSKSGCTTSASAMRSVSSSGAASRPGGCSSIAESTHMDRSARSTNPSPHHRRPLRGVWRPTRAGRHRRHPSSCRPYLRFRRRSLGTGVGRGGLVPFVEHPQTTPTRRLARGTGRTRKLEALWSPASGNWLPVRRTRRSPPMGLAMEFANSRPTKRRRTDCSAETSTNVAKTNQTCATSPTSQVREQIPID